MDQHGFPAPRVASLYRALQALGIEIWIDGGWGVDALLGTQTRAHADVDIVVQDAHLTAARSFLADQGFADQPQPDTTPWNFVLANHDGLKIDVHVIALDAQGNGIYGPPTNGESYPAAALAARGTIEGTPVRCLSPDYHVRNRSGYPPRETDFHDLRRLVERFGGALLDA